MTTTIRRALLGLMLASLLLTAPAPAGAQVAQSSRSAQQLLDRLPENPVFPPAPVHHAGAPTPIPFTPPQILRWYDSDISSAGGVYSGVVDQFPLLVRNSPEVMRANLDTVIAINDNADAATVERALADDHEDLMLTMADAWGPTLATHFRTAVAEGRLPRTTQLLAGTLARGGGIASSTLVEKYRFDLDRPFVVAGDDIGRHHRAGAEDEYSTTPAFPSGHTNQATWKSIMLAHMLPEFGPQMLARGSEVGYNRLVLGVHYPLDVIGGRMTGMAAASDRLLDPEFRGMLDAAGAELRAELAWRCGTDPVECAAADRPYLSDAAAVEVFTQRMDYGLPAVGPEDLGIIIPPNAQILLSAAHPELSAPERAGILAETASRSGAPLDRPGERGTWQRLNLAAAWVAGD